MLERAAHQTLAGASTWCSPVAHTAPDRRAPTPVAASLSVAVGQRPALQLDAVCRELAGAGFEVRGAATTCAGLTDLIAHRQPDLALVHAELDPRSPLQFVDGLRDAAPGMPIVVLLDELNPALAHAALAHEVDGVVLGDSSIPDLVLTLQRVSAGEAVYPCGWLRAAHRADGDSIERQLSDRQRDVLELLAEGLGNRSIAEALNISPNTVKFHIRQIYQRLDVTNRVEATLLFQVDRRVPTASSQST